jgi:hypothetical protein
LESDDQHWSSDIRMLCSGRLLLVLLLLLLLASFLVGGKSERKNYRPGEQLVSGEAIADRSQTRDEYRGPGDPHAFVTSASKTIMCQ